MNFSQVVPTGDPLADDDLINAARFILDEAVMLDEGRYDDWLALWSPTGVYWVPVDPLATAAEHISIIHDDRERLGQRVRRLQSRYNWTIRPPVRVVRLITHIRLVERNDAGLVAASNFVIGAYRTAGSEDDSSGHSSYFGTARHELERIDGGLRIAHKRIDLINSQGPLEKISFLL